MFDRETGKPKGYGFCEYKDQETALSAMRNLNGYELNGRALRVDSAASEKNREEMKGESVMSAHVSLVCTSSAVCVLVCFPRVSAHGNFH